MESAKFIIDTENVKVSLHYRDKVKGPINKRDKEVSVKVDEGEPVKYTLAGHGELKIGGDDRYPIYPIVTEKKVYTQAEVDRLMEDTRSIF
ncbi:hypothetical protein COU59_02345 [Candidatus Pacearchaeota archaeon CG10_big_fil_rev_8_21_14_0_10_34_12]|nr:MAG: hypothetical protein COU59_02345 [Candidatus Pacearchaeota archaeon CG10_big_fil_rev_8_21_14_0_10_34_12]